MLPLDLRCSLYYHESLVWMIRFFRTFFNTFCVGVDDDNYYHFSTLHNLRGGARQQFKV